MREREDVRHEIRGDTFLLKFPNLKVITKIYGQSQMSANFWYFYTVCIFVFVLMTLKIYIFPLFVLFSVRT
jgi:hypothetical protein